MIKRVGVIGGGQLAWMMSGAAEKLGIELMIQTPSPNDPAVAIASKVIFAPIDDVSATAHLANLCDVVTFENEFINLEALKPLAEQGVCFRPSLEGLAPLLDKYQQRCYLQQIGLPVPRFTALGADNTINPSTFPVVLKARRHGYDGKGTFILDSQDALEDTCQRLKGLPLMLEKYVPFEQELAVIAARSVTGEVAIYPVVETYQKQQVCRWVMAPAKITPAIKLEVERIARHLLEKLQVVGIFGIELFLTPEGQLLVNEIAPRTHNSGHYTLDACEVSQFEMQLRAVTSLPLGSPTLQSSGAVMVNLLGYENSQNNYQQQRQKLATIPHAYVHWYGKKESRPGRKLGHVTVLTDRDSVTDSLESIQQQLSERVQQIEAIWYG